MARDAYESIPPPLSVVQSMYERSVASSIAIDVVIDANGLGKGEVVGLLEARRVSRAKVMAWL